MSAEEGHRLWDAALLFEGYDSECAATAGFPINGEVFGVCLWKLSMRSDRTRDVADLDQIGVPSVFGDAEVVVALFLEKTSEKHRLDGIAPTGIAKLQKSAPSWSLVRRRGLHIVVVSNRKQLKLA